MGSEKGSSFHQVPVKTESAFTDDRRVDSEEFRAAGAAAIDGRQDPESRRKENAGKQTRNQEQAKIEIASPGRDQEGSGELQYSAAGAVAADELNSGRRRRRRKTKVEKRNQCPAEKETTTKGASPGEGQGDHEEPAADPVANEPDSESGRKENAGKQTQNQERAKAAIASPGRDQEGSGETQASAAGAVAADKPNSGRSRKRRKTKGDQRIHYQAEEQTATEDPSTSEGQRDHAESAANSVADKEPDSGRERRKTKATDKPPHSKYPSKTLSFSVQEIRGDSMDHSTTITGAGKGVVRSQHQHTGDVVNIGGVTINEPAGGCVINVGSNIPGEVEANHGRNAHDRRQRDLSPAQAAADKCERAIKKLYTTSGSYVQMIPWVDDSSKHIMDIYTSPQLQLKMDDQIVEIQSYEEIFRIKTREGHLVERIILVGLAGVGKSTLFDKIAYDWAMDNIAILSKYKLVFALKMHDLEQHSELIDSLFDQLLDRKTINRDDLNSFIVANPEKVLILLDGFDEFMSATLSKQSFGSILKILNRKEVVECCVVVSTRPSHLNVLVSKSLVQKPFIQAKILGFLGQDIDVYVKQFYPAENPDKAEKLLKKIQSSRSLFEMARSPMLLLIMCLLWREDAALPETLSRLFSEAVRYIFRRKIGDISPEEIDRIVVEVGKTGAHGLASPTKTLSFSESDFDKGVLHTALKVGLLTRQRVFKGLDPHSSIQFFHGMFQEFCAAKYCQSLLVSDTCTEEFRTIFAQILTRATFEDCICAARRKPLMQFVPDKSNLEDFVRFCCGDDETFTNKVVRVLLSMNPNDPKHLALKCYFESQSKSFPPVNLLTSVIREDICIDILDHDSWVAFVWFLKHVTDLTQDKGNPCLAKIRKLEMRSFNLQSFSADLAYSMKLMENLTILVMRECALTAKDVENIAPSLGETSLPDLQLRGNRTLGGSATAWAHCLQHMRQLKKLDVSACSLSGDDVIALVTSLHSIPTLVEFSLSGNTDLGGSGSSWSNSLQQIEHLQKLDLTFCSLTGEDVKCVVTSLGNLTNFLELNLSCNANFPGFFHFSILPKRRMYEPLWIEQAVFMASKSHESIRDKFIKNPSIVNLLHVNLPKTLKGSGSLWSSCLQQIKHLKKLELCSCALTGEDVKHIATSLNKMPNLVELDLSFNFALAGSDALRAPHMQLMKHAQNLDLTSCSLRAQDVKHIALSVKDMTNLAELTLSGNTQLGSAVSSWSRYLKYFKHLIKLELDECAITLEDFIKYLAPSIGCLTNLLEFSITVGMVSLKENANRCMMYSIGRILAEKCPSGIRLALSNFSLTGRDLAQILEGIGQRRDLVELLLISVGGLCDSANVWAPCLRSISALERLVLHGFPLQINDCKHVMASLILREGKTPCVELNLPEEEAMRLSAVLLAHWLKPDD